MQTVFIYFPKSGDRVFAKGSLADMAVIRYQNGCRHVVAPVKLSWDAAMAGDHWRAPGRTVLAAATKSLGGIAWDDQGTLNWSGTAQAACRIIDLMWLAHYGQPIEDETDEIRSMQMIRCGADALITPEATLYFDPFPIMGERIVSVRGDRAVEPESDDPVPPERERYEVVVKYDSLVEGDTGFSLDPKENLIRAPWLPDEILTEGIAVEAAEDCARW